MVIMLSLMMIASSFITFSFAEDPQSEEPKAEVTETAKESKPEPPKAKAPEPEPEPVKEKPPAPEPVKESAPPPAPEPAADSNSNTGGSETPDDVADDSAPSVDQTQEEVSEDIPQTNSDNEQLVQEEEVKEEVKEEEKEDEEEMPAQSFSGSAGGLSVSASAGKGVFPKGTKMKVSSASSSGIVAASQSLTGEDSEVVDAAAADITFYKNGSEIQPKGSVKINLRPTRALEGDTFKMIHVSGGGGVNVVSGASADGASASVSSFSIYGIIGEEYDEDTDTKARYTYNFYVGEELVDSQTVIDGEYLSAPADPKVASGKFKGWQIAGQSGMLDFSQAVSISDEEIEDKEFSVKAVISETFYATFWKDKNKTDILETKEGEKNAKIITSDVTWQFPDGKGITGWTLNGTKVTEFIITENVDLIPIISNDVVQVSFATGEGTPIPPVFVEVGTSLTEPDNPTRTGYTFKGWFTDEACSNVYNFSDKVENAFTLYAKWEGQKTTYKVVRWKQNANDDGYTFAEMETKSANAGLNAEYSAKNYQGFTLNSAKSNETVIIKGDGTTIKNVYYDRNTYPLTFYVYEKTGTNWWGGDVYDWVKKDTKNFRYEADTSAYWNQISAKYKDVEWFKGKTSNISYSAAPVMEPPGGGNLNGFAGISVYGQKVEGTSYVYYLDYADKTTKIRPDYVGGRVEWSFTEEDYIQIPGWTFKEKGKVGYEGKGNNRKYIGRLYYTRNNYGVKFIPGNGDASIERTAAYEAPINDLVPSNYNSESTWNNNGIAKTFVGWYDNEALVGEPVDFSSMKMPALHAGGSLVFYGKWTAEQHSVSFDLNGGTFDGSDSIAAQTVESGKEATAPDSSLMEKEGGYVFGGWVDDAGNRFSFDTQINKDYNLKAVWNSDKTKLLGIEYVVGDGTGSVSDSIMYQDGAYAVIKGQPKAPEGKYFEGWRIGSSDLVLASGSFQVKSEYAVDDTVTLTAQYADKPKYPTSVTYNLNGGNINGNTESIVDKNAVINGAYTVGNYEPEKADCTFIGWSTNLNGTGGVFSSGKKVAAGKDGNILYAQWKDNPKIGVKLTITGKSDDKTFNDKEQSVEGFECKLVAASSDGETIPKEAVSVELKADKKAKASGTNADTYKMGLTKNHFEIEVAKGYALVGDPEIIDGELKISPYPITVQISGNTKTVLENDQEQSVSGFKAAALGYGHPSSFNINNVSWKNGDTPVAKGTEPDTYPMGLDEKDFSYSDKNFDVTFKLISDGKLTITPKTKVKVIITGKSDGNKVYNGTEQSIEGFDYRLEEVPADTPVAPILRLFKGSAKASIPKDAVSVELKEGSSAKASGTDAGTYGMGLSKDNFNIAPKQGYKVVGDPDITDGVMKINPFKLTVLIKGETKSVPQNGQEQSVEGFKAEPETSGYPSSFNINNVLWMSGLVPEAKGTEPGNYTVKLNENDFSYADENFNLTYKIENDVELEITPVTVDIAVKKEWNDEGNKDEIRPSEVQVILLVNGDGVPDSMPITLSEDNEWTHTWDKLPKYNGEQVLEYSVAEMDVPEGYSAEVNGSEDGGFIITNTHIPEKEEEIKPPEIPNQKEDVLPAFEDETGDDDGGNGSGDDAVVKGKSSNSDRVNTGDSKLIIFFVKILSFAAFALLIMLISRASSERDSE